MSFLNKEQLLARGGKKKNPAPIDWNGDDHLAAGLKASGCKDASEMMKTFHHTITGNTGPIPRLPKNESAYLKPDGGIIPTIDVQQDGFGLWCQEEGHQGKVDYTTMSDICTPCNDPGASMKSIVQTWTCPPLELIKCSANAFLVVCTSRSSNGESIPDHFYKKLHNYINENSQLIRRFLRQQTGLEYEIHIIQDVAAHGSILASEDAMIHHDRAGPGKKELHLPLGYAASVLQYHYAKNWKVGYMMHCPGDYNGKISNYIANLKNFEIAGIDPASVIFMTYGLETIQETDAETGEKSWTVPKNFTIFSGEQLLERIEECRTPNGYRIPKSEEATIDGFITSASNHAATRKTRNAKRKN